MVAGDRMDKFGEFVLIDTMCLNYNYTHEEVFNLSWSEVMFIIVLGREKASIEAEVQKLMQRESNKR